MNILLTTERLFLRRFRETDTQNLFDLDNDPAVMRYINGGTPTAFEVIRNELLPRFVRYDERFPQVGFWAIESNVAQATGTPAFFGWVSLRLAGEDSRVAQLGYRLHKVAWGKGYATEAARALIDAGFEHLPVERIVATTYEKNVASQRVMEKVGMTLVRRFRLTTDDLVNTDTHHASTLDLWDGDDLDYALTRIEWADKQ